MNRVIVTVLAALVLTGCRGEKKADSTALEPQPAGRDAHAGHGHDEHGHGAEPGKDAAQAGRAAQDEHGKESAHEHDGKEEGGDHGDEPAKAIALAPEAVRAAQIQLVKAEARGFAETFDAPARVTFPQRGVARVGARVPGLLGEVRVEVGDRVQKGAVLGWLESPDLGQARAEFLAATTKLRVADENHAREKALQSKGISSARETREAENAVAAARADVHTAEAKLHTLGVTDDEISRYRPEDHPSARFALRSPIAGTVVEIGATAGQSVGGTEPLFVVGDLSALWVIADVYESQLAAAKVGKPVEIVIPALPGRSFRGTIEVVGDVIDERTRTVAVRIAVSNAERALKPGMYGTARIAAETGAAGTARPHAVIVPRDAVQKVGARQVVFVSAGENRFQAVEVKTGAESGAEVEVLSGIADGTPVVARGAFTLKSELSKESLSGGHAGHGH